MINLIGETFFNQFLTSNIPRPLYNYVYLLLLPILIDFKYEYISAINIPLWFIVLILQFYIIFQFLLKLLHKIGAKRFLIFTLIVTICFRLFITFALNQRPNSVITIETRDIVLFNTALARLAEFTFGMTLAFLYFHKKTQILHITSTKIILLGVALWITGLISTTNPIGWSISDPLLTTGLLCFWIPILNLIKSKLINNFLFSTTSISYIIFLIHEPLITQILVPLVRIGGQISNNTFNIMTIIGVITIASVITIFSSMQPKTNLNH